MVLLLPSLLLILASFGIVEARVGPPAVPKLSKPSFALRRTTRRTTPQPQPCVLQRLRGGSTKADPAGSDEEKAIRQYRLQQQLLLQSRSVLIRQELIARGLERFKFVVTDSEEAKPTDWDCALSTEEYPKSCLYSFDAEPGSKVVAPIDTTEWIALSALNRLRRTDPTKVEPLWHSKYSILNTWFDPNSPQSLYNYLSPRAAFCSFVLDAPWALGLAMFVTFGTAFLLTFPFWESLLTNFLTSSFLWMSWSRWGRFVHAAFPLKLLLGQYAWKFVASLLGQLHGKMRNNLIELECELWEGCIPRTIVEDSEEDDPAEEAEEEEDEEDSYEDGDELDEDSDDDIDLR